MTLITHEERRKIMSLTKMEIVESMYDEIGVPKKDCTRIVDSLFDIIKDELDKWNPVNISGFGKWTVRSKKARRGRNPKTGETMTIDARRVVTFKPSNVLRNSVNNDKKRS